MALALSKLGRRLSPLILEGSFPSLTIEYVCSLAFEMREVAWLWADGESPVEEENLMIRDKEASRAGGLSLVDKRDWHLNSPVEGLALVQVWKQSMYSPG